MSRPKRFKDPRKLIRHDFQSKGAEVTKVSKHGREWLFPDGYRIWIPEDISWSQAGRLVVETRVHGQRRQELFTNRRSGKPRLDLNRVTASTHAQERLAQMRAQSPISWTELLHTLRIPLRVAWSDLHESWIWVGERVALPVYVREDGSAVIKTVLWATEELWRANPRKDERPLAGTGGLSVGQKGR